MNSGRLTPDLPLHFWGAVVAVARYRILPLAPGLTRPGTRRDPLFFAMSRPILHRRGMHFFRFLPPAPGPARAGPVLITETRP
jgi:hypothetical protein